MSKTTTVFAPLPRGNIRQALAGQLLSAAIQGHFPDGHRMVVQKLAKQFQVSATPVREALVELAAIGIVELVPNRGAILKPFGSKQIQEIYQLRRILEVEATRCACGRIERELLEDWEQELIGLSAAEQSIDWSERAMELDVRLHRAIAENCGSDRLEYEINRYNTLVQVVREVVDNEYDAQQVALAEHLEIVRALLAEQANDAAEAMAEHIRSTSRFAEKAISEKLHSQKLEREAVGNGADRD